MENPGGILKTLKVLELGTSRVGELTKIGTWVRLWHQTPSSSLLMINPENKKYKLMVHYQALKAIIA